MLNMFMIHDIIPNMSMLNVNINRLNDSEHLLNIMV